MRPTVLSLLLLCAACAYDPLGIGVADGPDASTGADAGAGDAGVDEPVPAESVEPGCPADEGWCERTPHFSIAGRLQPPSYLNAMASNATGVWAAGQDFQILRWTGETWVQEHRSTGEVKAMWIDASGFGLAVGSVPGTVRKRQVMLRRPGGRWSSITLPVDVAEGDLTGVWGVAGDGGVTFRATTGEDVLLEGDETGEVKSLVLPGAAGAIRALENGKLDALLGGSGIWLIGADGEIEAESTTIRARSFFVSDGAIGAEGDGKVWRRTSGGLWVGDVAPTKAPVIACGGEGDPLMLTGGASIVRRDALVWRDETVAAPSQTSLSACLSLPDGSGWAVGYVIATGLPGVVLRQEAP